MTEKFTEEEKHLIINTLSRNAMDSERRESIAKCLAAKKQKGMKIDDQAIAICMNEYKSKSKNEDFFKPIPLTYKTVPYK